MDSIVCRIVESSRRHAVALVLVVFALVVGAGWLVSRRIRIDSDTGKLVDPNLPWQRAADDLDRQFPQNHDLLVVVVDGATPDQAGDAAAELARRMETRTDLFRYVRQPDANPFFRRYGLLFLSRAEVQDFADHLIAAQPFLGTLAADPSVRGVLSAIDLLAQGALHGEVEPATIEAPLAAVAGAVEAAAAGRIQPLSWQTLLSGRAAGADERRRFVLASAVLDYGQVDAASAGIAAIRTAATEAGLTPQRGVRVRVTGPVALNNDQLSALSEGATLSSLLCLGLLCFWLLMAVRSLRIAAAILLALLAGLVGCTAFAVTVIGPFNPVSIAFAPLFIGIAVDFGIQFSVRYSAEGGGADSADALRRTARGVGAPLAVAAAATAVGFLAFAPTAYLGVRDLGLIAGAGMIIALILNLTLLPALLTLLASGGRHAAASLEWGIAADRWLLGHRRFMIAGSIAAALVAAVLLPRLRLDFNPVDLQDPHAESVQTLSDLVSDPNTSPYSIEFLSTEPAASIEKLQKLPEVGRVLSLASFVPEDQPAKLEILADVESLLGPTLSPAIVARPPTTTEVLAAVQRCAEDMELVGRRGNRTAARLARGLRRIVQEGPASVPALSANLSDGIDRRLDDLREVFRAGPVTIADMPAAFRREWVAPDGRQRVMVFPRSDVRDNAALRRFARAVQTVVPQAVGSAVAVEEWTALAPRAFAIAGGLALVTIALLLLAVLRRIGLVVLVVGPLLLATLLTLGAAAALGLSINFANIITLPMILGIGVAFDIYFVMRHAAGESGRLGSSTARAIVFSALTTGSAFGSLALSRSPGMAEMGRFLALALFFILVCTLFVLPAWIGAGPPKRAERRT